MRFFCFTLIAVGLSGCHLSSEEIDPYESYNRQVFEFNEQADRYVLAPVVSLYQTVIPSPLRIGIGNFYSNIAELSYGINFLFQKDYESAYHSSLRLLVNSTFGVGGVFDMAHDLGLPKKKNDFGKTLYFWGVEQSPYMVSPFWGPSTIRDMVGMTVDRIFLNPMNYYGSQDFRLELLMLNAVETRSSLSDYIDQVNQTSFIQDRYLFIRDSYLQYRNNSLKDGEHNWDDFYNQDWQEETEDFVAK